jgi:hypothetical protein
MIKPFISLLISLLIFCSCQNSEYSSSSDSCSDTKQFPNFKEPNSGLDNVISKSDTLSIIVNFSDCGEWGGHTERILLHKNNKREIEARLIVDSVNCEDIKTLPYYDKHTKDTMYYSGIDEKSKVIIADITKTLSEKDEQLLNLFLHRVFELYLNDALSQSTDNIDTINIYGSAGTSIRVKNSDSTLDMAYTSVYSSSDTWYGRIRKEIFR